MQLPIISDVLDAILKGFNWVWSEAKWIYAAIVAFVMVPINFVLDFVNNGLVWLIGKWADVDAAVVAIGIGDISSSWGAASSHLAMANTVFPINFSVGLFLALGVLWVLCNLVRLVIRVCTLGLG